MHSTFDVALSLVEITRPVIVKVSSSGVPLNKSISLTWSVETDSSALLAEFGRPTNRVTERDDGT